MVAGSIPVRRSWTSRSGGPFLCISCDFEGGSLPLGRAALDLPPLRGVPRNAPGRCQQSAVNPAKAGSSSFSSKRTVLQNVMLTIADCHPEETQDRILLTRTAFYNNVCFEWHFARSHIHFVRVFSLRNASSPQRNTRGALVCNVTARYVLRAVTAQPL